MTGDRVGKFRLENLWIGDLTQGQCEGFKCIVAMIVIVVTVMIIFVMVVVMDFMADVHVGFGADLKPQQDVGGQTIMCRAYKADAGSGLTSQPVQYVVNAERLHRVSFRDNDHIGAGQLILEQLGQWRFVIQVLIRRALRIDGCQVIGELAGCSGWPIDHGNDTIDRDTGPDLRPVEGTDQGLGRARPDVSMTM